jgi:hypothetical protein
VTLGVGTNDMRQGATEEQFAENFEEIIIQLTKLSAPVTVMNLLDTDTVPLLLENIRQRTIIFNKRIAEITTQYHLPLLTSIR